MTTEQRITILKKFPLFKNLNDLEIKALAENILEKTFPPRVNIISPTQPTEGVYLIYEGLIKIYLTTIDGKIIPIRIRGPYYMIGEMNIFDDTRHPTIETLYETKTLMLKEQEYKKIVMNDPEVAFMLFKTIVEKLDASYFQTLNYFSLSLKERTLNMLKELAPYFSSNVISLSQEELANLIGANRARVSEVLNELRKQQKVSLKHRKITLL